jgi:hypothetical protein
MVGVGIQQFFICVFLVYAIKFHATTIQQNRQGLSTPQSAYMLLYAIYVVIILITVCDSSSWHMHLITDTFFRSELSFVLWNIPRGYIPAYLTTKRISTAWIPYQCSSHWSSLMFITLGELCQDQIRIFQVGKRERTRRSVQRANLLKAAPMKMVSRWCKKMSKGCRMVYRWSAPWRLSSWYGNRFGVKRGYFNLGFSQLYGLVHTFKW